MWSHLVLFQDHKPFVTWDSMSIEDAPTSVCRNRSRKSVRESGSRRMAVLCHNEQHVGWDVLFEHRNDPHSFALPPCPFRLDLHHTFHTRYIMTEAAPLPILRLLHQPALHRIAMHVA